MDTSAHAEALRHALADAPSSVVSAWLFGSRARGPARPGSGTDLAVLLAASDAVADPLGFTLGGDIEWTLGHAVDLVALNKASPDLVHRMLRDGVLLLDREPAARVRFEVAARNVYFDRKLSRSLPSIAPRMIDRDLVLEKLAFIETRVSELRTLARPERIENDVREERFVVHTLQLAIQAALDVASHVVSDAARRA